MDIRVRMGQEPRKGMMGGRNVKLTLEIETSLSEAERALVERYYDPTIDFYLLVEDDDYLKALQERGVKLKVEEERPSLSTYRIKLSTDDGFSRAGLMAKVAEMIPNRLASKLSGLWGLSDWDGERVLEVGLLGTVTEKSES